MSLRNVSISMQNSNPQKHKIQYLFVMKTTNKMWIKCLEYSKNHV